MDITYTTDGHNIYTNSATNEHTVHTNGAILDEHNWSTTDEHNIHTNSAILVKLCCVHIRWIMSIPR